MVDSTPARNDSQGERARAERVGGSRPRASALAEVPSVSAATDASDRGDPQRVPHSTDPRGARFLVFAALPGWLVSMLLHVVLLFCLAWITLPQLTRNRDNELTLGNAERPELADSPIFDTPQDHDFNDLELSDVTPTDSLVVTPSELVTSDPQPFAADDLQAAPTFTQLNPLGEGFAPTSDLLTQIGAISGEGLEGRGESTRARLVREGGGTEGSEKAVERALKWFQRHQSPDGSWSFQPLQRRCPCRDPGSLEAATHGATAMALLPFLGAGNTHREGQYQREVQAGLYYLLNRQQPNGSFVDAGNLYSHGLCAIALSEAYAMTQDQALMRPAQAALDYIVYAQDPVGGGWRYVAKQPGDTSVVGWQLMALKSGRMAYLHVEPRVFVGTSRFLDSVQTDSGSAYGYKDPGDRISTTAIGLLCRMYLGWGHDEPALQRGVERLSKSGPSDVDMYYNYYATQVMRHYEGEVWEKWNERMRDFLVKTQAMKGHEEGSWYMGNNHSSVSGGRVYCTSMATMVLEVYYRHLPLYRKQATDDDFEL
jgi:hypothetical protein